MSEKRLREDKQYSPCAYVNVKIIIMKKKGIKSSLSFGLTSGVITTLGLMVGLLSGTQSRIAVLGGIFTIAVVDAFSDAFGMHLHEESESNGDARTTWSITIITFFTKFFIALTFVVPILIFSLTTAVTLNIIYGLFIMTIFSYLIAKESKQNVYKVMGEHILLTVLIIAITYSLGILIQSYFS